MPGRRDLFRAPEDLPFGVYREQMGAKESNDLFPPACFNKTPDTAWCHSGGELMPSVDNTAFSTSEMQRKFAGFLGATKKSPSGSWSLLRNKESFERLRHRWHQKL